MSAAESKSEVVLALAEEFLDRYRRGERPPLKEYTDLHPDLASEIHEVFPAMALMENIAVADESLVDGAGTAAGNGSPTLRQLGDFRIIREVGQGGMGIVYEAEQVSLGRHVALKVLPRQVIRDAKLRRRFEREAKSAAKLHHTNIVPVYGVGEHDGTPYYVMQFIQGLGLDEVISELGRLAPGRSPAASSGPVRRSAAVRAAQSMMTGEFGAEAEDGGDKPDPNAATLPPNGAILEPPEAEAPVTGSGHATTSRRADTAVLSSVTLPGLSESGTGRKAKKLTYWQSVARVGVQVADALEHAHRQGVIHRDVKPSNLLLDLGGTVWVTDFGLAKADDQQNLTHTGDVLGTLRYMPPEAFHGKADARGDVYSLGLTLYELAALRPAFNEKDRLGLVRQITEDEAPSLRKLRPDVPRDLETIIAKAIEKAPGDRYQSAADLAVDLQRFLDDEPIQARRLTGGERAWRWCRRNPVIAGLIGVIQLTLVGLIALGAWSNARISRALGDKEQALIDKGTALAETEAARGDAVKLRDAAVAETYRALLSETKALRLAHVSGWRYQALQKLGALARLETPRRDLTELRSEAIACAGEFDAYEVMRLVGHSGSIWSLDFNPDGTQLASAGYDGRVQIWDVNEGRQVTEITDSGLGTGSHRPDIMLPAVRYHPDGGRVAFTTWKQGVGLLDLRADQEKPASIGEPVPGRYLAFDGEGRMLATSTGDGRVNLYDTSSRKLIKELRTGVGNNLHLPVALSPKGDLLAMIGADNAVQLYELPAAKEPITLGRHRFTVRSLCFNSSGTLLASGSEDNTVKVWDVRGNGDPLTLLGHTARVNCVAFSPDGRMIAAGSDDQTVRFWDARDGQPLMVLNPQSTAAVLAVAFSPDGRRLAVTGAGVLNNRPICVYQLTSRQEQRHLPGHSFQVDGLAFHPVKPLLASGGPLAHGANDKTIIISDLRTGQPRNGWPAALGRDAIELAFSPDGSVLAAGLGPYANSKSSNYAVELRDPDTGLIRRRLNGPFAPINALAFDPSGGRLVAGTISGEAFVWNTTSGSVMHQWKMAKAGVGVSF